MSTETILTADDFAAKLAESAEGADNYDAYVGRLVESGVLSSGDWAQLDWRFEPRVAGLTGPEQVAALRGFLLSSEGAVFHRHRLPRPPVATPDEGAGEGTNDADDEPPASAPSRDASTKPTFEDPLELELASYEGELLPGAAKLLAGYWKAELARMPAERLAEEVARRLAPGGIGEPYLDPEREPSRSHPVKQILSRYARAGLIPAESVGLLFNRWAAELAGLDASTVAARIRRRLGEWENRRFVSEPYRAAMPHNASRVHRVLCEHFAREVRTVERGEQLAVEHAELGKWSDEAAVVRAIAYRLGVPQDDPRHKAVVGRDRTAIRYGEGWDAPSKPAAWAPPADDAIRPRFNSL